MQYKCKVTVIDKKVYPELQARYCANPNSGPCPCYEVGDEYIFARYRDEDDFWHLGIDTIQRDESADGIAGTEKLPTVRKHGTLSAAIFTRRFRAAPLCAIG